MGSTPGFVDNVTVCMCVSVCVCVGGCVFVFITLRGLQPDSTLTLWGPNFLWGPKTWSPQK